MYSNKFVIAVFVNGIVQEEKLDGTIELPLGTTYQIRLRNKNSRRAVAKLFIDGENVSDGGFLIYANSYVDIKRFADRDQAFKFVALASSSAMLAGKDLTNKDKQNGVVEAHLYFEKEVARNVPTITNYSARGLGPGAIFQTQASNIRNDGHSTYTHNAPSMHAMMDTQCSINAVNCNEAKPNIECCINWTEPIPNTGCTVGGSTTAQRFVPVQVDLEENCTVIKLVLVPKPTSLQATNDMLEQQNALLRQQILERQNRNLKAELERLNNL